MGELTRIQQYLSESKMDLAKHELIKLLRTDPHNSEAWLLLGSLLEDEDKQVDCYRHVLSLEPGHHVASSHLKQLTYHLPPTATGGEILRCPQCGGTLNMRFVGEMREKRAICLHCGTEVDLPDSAPLPSSEHQAVANDADIIPHRQDANNKPISPPPADITERRSTMSYIEQRMAPAIKLSFTERVLKRLAEGLSGGKSRGVSEDNQNNEEGQQNVYDLTPDDIIRLAGGPLAPEERRQCPKCQATIAKDAKRCEWCGLQLD